MFGWKVTSFLRRKQIGSFEFQPLESRVLSSVSILRLIITLFQRHWELNLDPHSVSALLKTAKKSFFLTRMFLYECSSSCDVRRVDVVFSELQQFVAQQVIFQVKHKKSKCTLLLSTTEYFTCLFFSTLFNICIKLCICCEATCAVVLFCVLINTTVIMFKSKPNFSQKTEVLTGVSEISWFHWEETEAVWYQFVFNVFVSLNLLYL